MDNKLYEDIGHIKAMVMNIQQDISEVKEDIKENIYPSISLYSRDRNMIIGGCIAVSALFGAFFGGIGKAIERVFHG